MGFCAYLPAGGAAPLEKTGVCLEPSSRFSRIYSKINEKTGTFGLFLNKLPKNYQNLLEGGGARHCGTSASQGMSPRLKCGVAFGEEPNFSPRAPRPYYSVLTKVRLELPRGFGRIFSKIHKKNLLFRPIF